MDVTSILLLLLIGALATYFSGDKLASKVALLFSLATFGLSLYLVSILTNGGNISFSMPWKK